MTLMILLIIVNDYAEIILIIHDYTMNLDSEMGQNMSKTFKNNGG